MPLCEEIDSRKGIVFLNPDRVGFFNFFHHDRIVFGGFRKGFKNIRRGEIQLDFYKDQHRAVKYFR